MAIVGTLEVERDLNYERKSWITQRIGWIVMALVVVAGTLGLLGPGLLSYASAADGSGKLTVDYQRFGRLEAPEEMRMQIGPGAASSGSIRVWIARDFLERHLVEAITPEPEKVEAAGDRMVFHFPVTGVQSQTAITFRLEPQWPGKRECRVGLVDGPEVRFGGFVYP